jgi:hypothetical protein
MFDAKSRYANLTQYTVIDRRGRVVSVVPVAPRPDQVFLGIHVHKQGQRPDHLAWHYVTDQAGFWRIAEMNDVMLSESVTEMAEIDIPSKK